MWQPNLLKCLMQGIELILVESDGYVLPVHTDTIGKYMEVSAWVLF